MSLDAVTPRVGWYMLAGWREKVSDTIENRLTKVERDLAILKTQVPRDKSNWIADITGAFKDDPDFDEIVRLGKELREAEPRGEDDPDVRP
jgi:hypothetical protein